MAGGIRGITIEIGGDTTKLGKALESSEKQSRSLQSELRQIEKLLKFDPGNVELLTQKQNVLTDSISETSKKLKTLKDAEKDVVEQFNKGDIGADQMRAFRREIAQTENALNGMQTELKQVENALSNTKKHSQEAAKETKEFKEAVEDAKEALSDLGEKASEAFDLIKTGAGTLTGVAVAAGGYALNLTTEFDKALNTLIAKTGATADETEELEAAMTAVYSNNFGDSIEDVAVSMATVKTNTGLMGEELQTATEQALMMRDTFDFDVNESTRSAKMLMDQYGMSAENAFNLIAIGAQNGLDKNGDLLDTVNEYAVHFNQLGFTADDMFTMLASGAENGTFSVDKLGDAVKEFGIRVKDGTADEAFVELGLAVEDVSEELDKANGDVEKYQKTVGDLENKLELAKTKQSEFNSKTKESTKIKVAQDIEKYSKELETARGKLDEAKNTVADLTEVTKLSGNSADDLKQAFASGGEDAQQALQKVITALFAIKDPVKQNQLGVELFGTMWEDLGASGVQALFGLESELDTTKNALEEIGNVKYDDLGSAFEGLKRTLETDIGLSLGETLKPYVEDLIVFVQENSGKITSVVTSIVDGLASVFNFISENGALIAAAIAAIGAGFVTWNIVSTVTSVIGVVTSLWSVMQTGVGVMGALTAVMNMSPIGIIITAVAALVAAFIVLWNNCEGFRNFWVGLWETIKAAFAAVVSWFQTTVPKIGEAFSKAWDNVKTAWSNVTGFFSDVWSKIKDAFKFDDMLSIGKNIVEGLWEGIGNATAWLKDKISDFVGDVTSWLKKFFGIKSPSTVMRDQIGRYISEGIGVGIIDNEDKPLDALHELSNDMLDEGASLNGATIVRKLNHTFGDVASATNSTDGALLKKLDGIYARLNNLQIVLDTGTLVGETIDKIDSNLANRQTLALRGV